MAVQLPQFMPFQTGTQFVDNLLGLRRQGSQERQVDIMQRQADTDEGRLALDTRELEDVRIPEALAKMDYTKALTGHQELVSEEQEILNYFLTDEKELNLEHLDLTNETLRLQNMMLPELTQAEIGMLNAQIDKVMAETGMINAEAEFFIKTMPLREDTLELQRKLLSHDEREREQAVQEYMDLIPERIAATRASYVREGLKNEVLQSQLDTDEIIREAKLQRMDLTAKEIEALKLTNEMLAMDTEQRGAILPYETDAIIAKLKAKEQSAILQTAEDLAGLLYRDLEGEITRAAMRDKAETDMIQYQRDIVQMERDFHAFNVANQITNNMYAPHQERAWQITVDEMQKRKQHLYESDEARLALVHEYLGDAEEFFNTEMLEDILSGKVKEGFTYGLLDALSKNTPAATGQFFANIRDSFLGTFEAALINAAEHGGTRKINIESLTREDLELYLEEAMNEFIISTPEVINDRIMGEGSALFGKLLGQHYDQILKRFNIPNIDVHDMTSTMAQHGFDFSAFLHGGGTGEQAPQGQPTDATGERPIYSPFGFDTAPQEDTGLKMRPLSFMPQY